jgi:hypothetical protein
MNIFKFAKLAYTSIHESFAPSRKATSREVRVNGIRCVGAGIACLTLAGMLMYWMAGVLKIQSSVAGLPVMFAYFLILIGGYRFATGKNESAGFLETHSISLVRIFFGMLGVIAATIISMLILIPLFWLFSKK